METGPAFKGVQPPPGIEGGITAKELAEEIAPIALHATPMRTKERSGEKSRIGLTITVGNRR
jgi:hypothetical protein